MTKLGATGFGTSYDMLARAAQSAPSPTGSQAYKTSVTQKPDGTMTQSEQQTVNNQNNQQASSGQGYFQMPWQNQSASQAYQNMLNSGGGMADYDAWQQSFAPQMQFTINDAINQAMQQGGRAGMMNSTPMARMQGNIGAQAWAGLVPQFLQARMQMQNAANQNYLNAAQGLGNEGQSALYGGMNYANNLMNMAGGYQGAQNAGLGMYQNEMARMRGENNPYAQWALQGMNAQNQVAPVQYQPSAMSQILGTATGLGGAWLMGGGGNPFKD